MHSKNPSPWTPILSGNQAIESWKTIQEIADAINSNETLNHMGPSLSGGLTGVAIFYGYLSHHHNHDLNRERCFQLQETASSLLSEQPSRTGLFSGFTGVGWGFSHLRDLLDPESEDPADEIDQAILQLLDRPRWTEDYDLIGGLVGLGVYGLERLRTGAGSEILSRVIHHLDLLAIHTGEGTSWFTAPRLLPQWQRELAPDGYWNLGLAHGVPGVLALLGHGVRQNILPDVSRRLLEGGVRWLLSKQNTAGTSGWFGNTIPEGKDCSDQGSRVAWCYGDLGLSVALLSAARNAGRHDWETQAISIAEQASRRPREQRGVQDPVICHGTAGNALLFMRLFHATQMECFRKAAIDHLEWTLALRKDAEPWGGFPRASWNDQKALVLEYTPGLLEGSAGVGLVLLAAVSNQEPAWDRHLLTSMEPRIN